ncbi:MAG: hypothetical protein NUV82_04450, partial [Candidatus Komeilibacteria bacterium]|nr:hypothetical protein [Candidatus Komeilibacteria bacterium]
MNKKNILILCLLITTLSLIAPVVVGASSATTGAKVTNPFDDLQVKIPGMERFTEISCAEGEGEAVECGVPWIGEYIAGLYNYGVGLVAVLAVVMIMVG